MSDAKLYEAFFWIEPSSTLQGKDAGTFNGTKVIWHHPDDVSQVIKSFRNIPQFCFPDLENIKIENINNKAKTMRRNEHFTFTLQEQNGNRVYGICFRSLFSGVLGRFDTPRRARHCLCFITRNPLFNLFRMLLLQVHSLCLLSKDLLRARHFLDIVVAQANQCLANAAMTNIIYCQISKNAFPGICNDITISSPRKSGLRLSSKEVSVLPLLELLGTEKLLTLLGAVLCERRVLFIANDVEIISNSVLAVASLIDPFSWQHVFIPLLPGKLLDYASAPMPYLIGLRKYWYDKIPSDALGDVLVVDVDSGDMRTFGTDVLKNTDFVGESANTLNQITENFDRVFAKASNLFGMLTKSEAEDAGPRDIVAFIVNEIKGILSSKPGSNVIASVATGLIQSHHSREEQVIQWAAESEKSLRDTIMLLFVYLFAIFDDYVVNQGSKPQVGTKAAERGVAAKGDAFGAGDSRSNFNINAFKSQRRQLGDSPDLLNFLNELMHSQIFEQFCDEQIKKRGNPATATSKGGDEVEVFNLACKKLRISRQSITVSSAKAAVTECSRGEGFDKMGFEFHNLTYQFTEQKEGDKTPAQVQAIIERICLEAYHSSNMFRILRTVKIRIDSSVAANGRGSSGAAGTRALQLLRHILITGPVAATTYAIDLIPQIRLLIKTEKQTKKSGKVGEVLDFMTEKDYNMELSERARSVLELLVDGKTLMVQRRFSYLRLFSKEAEKTNLTKTNTVSSAEFFDSSSSSKKQDLMTTVNVGGGQCNRSFPSLSSIHKKLQSAGCQKFTGTLTLKQPIDEDAENGDEDDNDEDDAMSSLPDAETCNDLKDDSNPNAKYRIVNKDTSEVLDLRVLDKMTPKGPSAFADRKPLPNVPILSPPPTSHQRTNKPALSPPPAKASNSAKSTPTNSISTSTTKKSPVVDPFFNDNSAASWEMPSTASKPSMIPASTATSSGRSDRAFADPFAITTDPFASTPTAFATTTQSPSPAPSPAKPPKAAATLLDDVFDLTMPVQPLKSVSSPPNTSVHSANRQNAPINPFDNMPGFNNFSSGSSNSNNTSSSSCNMIANSKPLMPPPGKHVPIPAVSKDPFADLMFLEKPSNK